MVTICQPTEVGYNKFLKENKEEITSWVKEVGYCYIKGELCEGCQGRYIRIGEDFSVDVEGVGCIGKINQETFEIVIDKK